MSLVAVREYSSAEEMLTAYRARLRPSTPIVIVRESLPAVETKPAKQIAEVTQASIGQKASARQILRDTCERHKVRLECVLGSRRYKPLSDCRREAAWLIAKETKLSYPQIGQLLCKDHTSILMCVRRQNEITGENVRNVGGVPEKTRERDRMSALKRKEKTRAMRLRISEMKRNREDFRL